MGNLTIYLRAAKWILMAVIFVASFTAGWHLGSDRIQAKWDAANASAEKTAIKREREDQKAADVVGQEVAAAAVKERVVYKTLIKEIPKYVESNCDLSGGFRVLHDAAATATVPDPGTHRADAATVKAQDLAATVTENYEACRDSERRLEALQEIIRKYNQE